jgi:hypothetical protein
VRVESACYYYFLIIILVAWVVVVISHIPTTYFLLVRVFSFVIKVKNTTDFCVCAVVKLI